MKLLLHILRLEKCKDTLVGNEFVRGISGGEKKRVTVGVDLMKGSDLILMDGTFPFLFTNLINYIYFPTLYLCMFINIF